MTAGKITLISLVALVLGFAGMAEAKTVKFNLFDLGCPHHPSRWITNFNLKDTFSEISHVYIDWSGEFTAGLVLYDPNPPYPYPPPWPPPPDDPSIPFPVDVYLSLNLYKEVDYNYRTLISGGAATYPAPESFAAVSELSNSESYSPYGSRIDIIYKEPIGRISYIEHGSLILNRATLIVEGTVIPEPTTLSLFSLGSLALLRKRRS